MLAFIPLQKLQEVHIFTGGTYTFCHEVFFRMYLPLALEVYNMLFVDSLKGFMAVNEFKKYLLGRFQTDVLTFALISGLTLWVWTV